MVAWQALDVSSMLLEESQLCPQGSQVHFKAVLTWSSHRIVYNIAGLCACACFGNDVTKLACYRGMTLAKQSLLCELLRLL